MAAQMGTIISIAVITVSIFFKVVAGVLVGLLLGAAAALVMAAARADAKAAAVAVVVSLYLMPVLFLWQGAAVRVGRRIKRGKMEV